MEFNNVRFPNEITTIDDVKTFGELLIQANIVFYPDDDICIDENPELSKHLNMLMEQCFDVCDNANEDLYGIMFEIIEERLLKDLS